MSRTVHHRLCGRDGCDERYDDLQINPWPKAFCSAECARLVARARTPAERRRPELVTRSTPKQRRAISPANPQQRAKRATQPSIVSGATTRLDPAHVALRGCDDPLCTVSLTREEHRAFDDGALDLLPYLVKAGCVAEIAHAVHHYDGNLPALLARLTGTRWAPAANARPVSAC